MNATTSHNQPPFSTVALITGAAKRLGAATAKRLHQCGMSIVIHYQYSEREAAALMGELNDIRTDSAIHVQADLAHLDELQRLADVATDFKGGLSVLINNASSFYPTTLESAQESDWNDLFASNAKAPYFLCQALSNTLKENQGCIINMVDIHAQRPLKDHSIYSMAKSSLITLTKSLAKELAPEVRVNAVAPGAILWPDNISEIEKKTILAGIPLQRLGKPEDIADTIRFLVDADYITGQVIAVDGGRSL